MESGDHNTMLEKYSGLQKKTSSTSIKRKLQSDDPGLTLSWSGLSVYCVKKSNSFWSSGSDTKKLVNNVTGVAKAGTLTAVLGASGAGKTTLLSALAQRNNGGLIVEGDVRVNGKVIGPHIRNLSAFLYQKDLFFATLTVYEHLVFYARMKLDRRISKTEIKEKVHEILRQVGLLNVAHRQIGTSGDHFQIFLSGGEKRRLSFATELLSDPDLFFCDEVTSGLDSYSTLNLITTMKDMASHHQKTIICAIHQPSSEILDLFDSLVILAESRTAFIGNAKQGVEFMRTQGYPCPRNYNPADFFIKILAVIGDDEVNCRKRLKIICDAYVSSDAAQSIDARIDEEIDKHRFQPPLIEGPKRKQARPHIKPATWLTKLLLVTYRLQVDIFRNKKYLTFRLVQKAIVGIMMGWIYSGSLTRDQPGIQALEGFFLSLAIQNVASPLYASISKFQRQFPLFLRDYEDGLVSSLQFFTAMLLAWLPIILFESVLVTSSFYLLAGAFMTFHIFCTTLYIVSLAAMVSLLCGMSFAASIASFEICSYVLSELLSIVNILSGFYMNLRSVPVYLKLFELISWQRYTMEVLSIVHLPPASSFSCTPSTIPGLELPCLHTGRQVLDKYGYEPARLVGDFFWMWGLIVSFYVIGYAFFWRRMVKLTTV